MASQIGDKTKTDFYEKFNAQREAKGKSTIGKPLLQGEVDKRIAHKAASASNVANQLKSSSGKSKSGSKSKSKAGAIGEGVNQKKVRENLNDINEKRGFIDTLLHNAAKPLDLLQRPAYSVQESLRSAMQAINEGEPIWSIGDDLIYGAKEGITGKAKTGYGDVVEEATNYDFSQGTPRAVQQLMPFGLDKFYGGKTLAEAEQQIPEAAKWIKRGLGFTGELALDPTMYASFGVVSAAKQGSRVAAEEGLAKGLKAGAKAGYAKDSEGLLHAGIKSAFKHKPKTLVGRAMVDEVKDTVAKTYNEVRDELAPDLVAKYTARTGFQEASDSVAANAGNLAERAKSPAFRPPVVEPKYSASKATKADKAKIAKFAEDQKKRLDLNEAERLALRSDAEQVLPDWARVTDAGQKLIDDLASSTKRLSIKEIDDALIKAAQEVEKKAPDALDKILGPKVLDPLDDVLEGTIDELFGTPIAGGPLAGRSIHHSRELPKLLASNVANRFSSEALQKSEKYLDEIAQAAASGKPLSKATASAMEKNKYVKAFREAAFEHFNSGKSMAEIRDIAHADMIELINKDRDYMYQQLLPGLTQRVGKAPVIRVLGGKEVTLRRTGDLFDRVGKAMDNNGFVEGVRKAFSYNYNMPGYSSVLTQRVKSQGHLAYQEYFNAVKEYATTFSAQDRKLINKALEQNLELPAKLQQGVDWIRQANDQMFWDEVALGILPAKARKAENYAFLYLRGGSAPKRRAFKELRDKEIQQYGKVVTADFDEAVRRGLRPEKDAFVNLLARRNQHQRKLVNFWYADELTGQYGVAIKNLHKGAERELSALANDLVKVDRKSLSLPLREALKPGEEYYLPKGMHHTMETFRKLNSGLADDDLQQFLRMTDWVTNKFKASATLPFPSYHMNNMIGDTFMGWLDGVKKGDFLKLYGNPSEKIKIGGEFVERGYIRQAYESMAASGGFYNTDVGGRGFNRVLNTVKNKSEQRENFGRMAHFYHAMDEELPAARKVFPKDHERAWKIATENATARVNAYKFDYSALTPFEKNIMKRVVPFYTFQRKALPILMQSLLMSPRKMTLTGKGLNLFDGDNINDADLPNWVKELGYMEIPGTDVVMTKNILPTGLFADYLEPGYGEDRGASNLANNALSKINPILQVPFEIKEKKTSFTGKKLGEGAVPLPIEAVLSHFRPYTTVGQVEGLKPDNPAGFLRLLTGLPLTQINDDTKEWAFKQQEDSVQSIIYKANAKLATRGLKVGYVKRKNPDNQEEWLMEYRVYQLGTDGAQSTPLATGISTYEEALKQAQAMAGG